MTLRALVTSGPTREKLDPVRYISNYSSGKQGYAIAEALKKQGIEVTLISGPTHLPTPKNITLKKIESSQEMLDATLQSLPVDIAICCAAVCDWQLETPANQKQKKQNNNQLTLNLTPTPDILKTLSTHHQRPKLVIGFAAETENIIHYAQDKLHNKQCDAILANPITQQNPAFNQEKNHIYFVTKEQTQDWKTQSKTAIATQLSEWIMKQPLK